MLGKTDPQGNFFNSYIEEYFLPTEHELLEVKENVDFPLSRKKLRIFMQKKWEDLLILQ